MAVSTPIKGDKIYFKIGSVIYSDDILEATLKSEEDGDVEPTFAETAAGGAVRRMVSVKAVQSTKTGSFHRMLEDTAGGTLVAVEHAVHGNTAGSAEERIANYTVKVPAVKPDIGGAAQKRGRYTFSTELEVVGDVTWDTTA